MNKIFLFALIATLALAADVNVFEKLDLGTENMPILNSLLEKANHLAGDYAKDPCVQKISMQMQMSSILCLYEWHQKRNIMDTVNCAMNITTKAKDQLLNECKIPNPFN